MVPLMSQLTQVRSEAEEAEVGFGVAAVAARASSGIVARGAVLGLQLLLQLLISLLREADASKSLLCNRGGARNEEHEQEERRQRLDEFMWVFPLLFLFFSLL